MAAARLLLFDTFRLDLVNECVWRGEQALQLTPKAFALLRYLAEHPGQLVTKDELLKVVWPEVVVSEGVLTTHIGVLRQALGDDAKAPRYIETVHRRGYRFIAPLTTTQPVVSSASSPRSRLAADHQQLTTPLVGREAELAQLHSWLEKALRGERQVVFVTGEAGIGKTTVVDAFVIQAAADAALWVGHGQCIEQFGPGEAYLPLLAAFGQLCREPGHEQVLSVLEQYAPTWLVQMPALLPLSDFETLQRRTAGATRERMLREIGEALEALTATRSLLLLLEDLHWSDPSTLELLSFLARRRQPAHLLVIGTYRPVEVLANGHPLRAVTQELQLHRHCEELALQLLSDDHIVEYLTARFMVPSPAQAGEGQGEGLSPFDLQKLARLIHRRTEGNPLFMVTIIADLLVRGTLDHPEIEVNTPTTLRQMIERQFDHLTPAERRVLEVASVTGVEFSAAAVAAGVAAEVAQIETRCADLARRGQFVRASGVAEWPDGTVAGHYGFLHALYQEVVYERVAVSRRSALHQRIGERLEGAYKERAKEVAAELAVHFERGQDYQRAVQYLRQAGENAIQRSAHIEAISHFTKGLELLKTLPDTHERAQQELALQLALGAPFIATKGYAAQEAGEAYTRAHELCQQLGETPQLFSALWGLCAFYTVRAEYNTARELGEQMLHLVQNAQDRNLLVEAHAVLGIVLFYLGELALARAHLEQRIALDDPLQHHTLTILYGGVDPGVHCLSYTIATLWLLGYPTQALKMSHETLTLARELSHPFGLSVALCWATILHQLRREEQTVQERAEAMITLCREKEVSGGSPWGVALQGWALAEQGQGEEGIAQIRQSLTLWRTVGREGMQTYALVLLAEVYGRAGQAEEGLSTVAEALAVVSKTGERWYEAELYRVKGKLTLQSQTSLRQVKTGQDKSEDTGLRPLAPDPHTEAEAYFLKAIEIARKQQAKSLELRATMSLARLWQQQGKRAKARRMLAEVYNWFTEGFDTKDLQEAKALLDDLARGKSHR